MECDTMYDAETWNIGIKYKNRIETPLNCDVGGGC